MKKIMSGHLTKTHKKLLSKAQAYKDLPTPMTQDQSSDHGHLELGTSWMGPHIRGRKVKKFGDLLHVRAFS